MSRIRRAAIMPVGPSVATWRFPKSTNTLNLSSIAYGLTMNRDGEIFVTVDVPKRGGMVQCYDKMGNSTHSFELKPSSKLSKKYEPFQICEMPNGNLAVACSSCITLWTKEGRYIDELGRHMFKFVKNIAVRSTGEIVVSDSDDSGMLKTISSNGQFITKIETDLTCPGGVTVDSEDNIIVTDWKHTVRIYDRDNVLVRSFGVKGSRDNEMDMPYGICVDCEDNIIIADMWNHRVSVYSPEGKFINHIATQSTNGVHRPQYVAILSDPISGEYKLAVSEFWNNTVRLLEY